VLLAFLVMVVIVCHLLVFWPCHNSPVGHHSPNSLPGALHFGSWWTEIDQDVRC
jgi:hypothetical protein